MRYISWATGGFTPDCWHALRKIIEDYKVKSVLEYGSGVSTELLMAYGVGLVSLETQEKYLIDDAPCMLYAYPDFPVLSQRFDLAFIDGPGAYEFESTKRTPERAQSAVHAAKYTNLIVLHDGGLGQIEPLIADGFKQTPPGDSGVGARMILFRRTR